MDDISLVEKVLSGDINAFEAIIDKYEEAIFRFIYSIVGQKEVAEDLCQETFIKVYNKLNLFNKEAKFSTWTYQIAKNTTIDYIRANSKIEKVSSDCLEIAKSSEESPEDIVEFKDTKSGVEQFIKTLDPVDKKILSIRYNAAEITFKEIAEILNMNLSTVKKRYYNIYNKYKSFTKPSKSYKGSDAYEL